MSLAARVDPARDPLGRAPHAAALDATAAVLRAAASALKAEWTKFRTVAGPSWLLAGRRAPARRARPEIPRRLTGTN